MRYSRDHFAIVIVISHGGHQEACGREGRSDAIEGEALAALHALAQRPVRAAEYPPFPFLSFLFLLFFL